MKNCQCSSQGQSQGLHLRGQGHRSQRQGHKNLASRPWPQGLHRWYCVTISPVSSLVLFKTIIWLVASWTLMYRNMDVLFLQRILFRILLNTEMDNVRCYPDLDVQKIDFANNLQLSLTLTAMSIGLWWLFDRSRSGFGLGISIAVIATVVSQLLVYNGIYR